MATLTISNPTSVQTPQSYLFNVGQAVRALLIALLGVQSTQAIAGQADANLSMFHLQSLATPYDAVMPELANELRYMAARAN